MQNVFLFNSAQFRDVLADLFLRAASGQVCYLLCYCVFLNGSLIGVAFLRIRLVKERTFLVGQRVIKSTGFEHRFGTRNRQQF